MPLEQLVRDRKELLTIWHAATLGSTLRTRRPFKRRLASLDIAGLCQYLDETNEPFALRISARLVLGLVKILQLRSGLIYSDALHLWARIRRELTLTTGTSIVDMPTPQARLKNITLQEMEQVEALANWTETQTLRVPHPFANLFDWTSGEPAMDNESTVDIIESTQQSTQQQDNQTPAELVTDEGVPSFGAIQQEGYDTGFEIDLGMDDMDILADAMDDHAFQHTRPTRRRRTRELASSDSEVDPWYYSSDEDRSGSLSTRDLSVIVSLGSPDMTTAAAAEEVPVTRRRRLLRSIADSSTVLSASFYGNTEGIVNRVDPNRRLVRSPSTRARQRQLVKALELVRKPSVSVALPATHILWQYNARRSRSSQVTIPLQQEIGRRDTVEQARDRGQEERSLLLESEGRDMEERTTAASSQQDRSSSDIRLESDDDRRSGSAGTPVFNARSRPGTVFEQDDFMDDIDYGGGDDGYDAPYQFSDPIQSALEQSSSYYNASDFLQYAKLLVRDGSNSITMDDLFPSTTNTLKSEVARAFQHILTLASREMVTLEQRTPYELIHIEFTD